MESPYRAAVAQAELEAQTALGPVRLTIAPKHTSFAIAQQTWTIANDQLSVVTRGKRRQKRRSIMLRGAHLYVARAWPTNEFSLWLERKPGVVQRMVGLPPVPGLDQETVQAWRMLEALAGKLEGALESYADGASAFEMGQGQHRVFSLRFRDRLVVFARPVFRERPRRIIEVRDDGSLILPKRGTDRLIEMKQGVEIIATGDRIQFCHPSGQVAASIFLPWIGPADRVELSRRAQLLVGGGTGLRRRKGKDSELSLNARLSTHPLP